MRRRRGPDVESCEAELWCQAQFSRIAGVLILACSLGANAAPPAPVLAVRYSAPAEPAQPLLADYDYDKWEGGQRLCAASDEVNLRERPDAAAPSVATLVMGSEVIVQRVASEAVQIQQRVDRWYEVETRDGKQRGYVFGGALTPICLKLDLDGDGDEEVVTVAMSWQFTIRVRVLEPNAASPRRIAFLDLPPAGGDYLGLRGGNARVAVVGAAKAGIPLLEVASAPEACADYSTTWVSYRAPARRPGGPPKVAVALRLAGFADGGTYSAYEVTFDPKRRDAVVVRTSAQNEVDSAGREVTTQTRERYRLRGGVFEEEAK